MMCPTMTQGWLLPRTGTKTNSLMSISCSDGFYIKRWERMAMAHGQGKGHAPPWSAALRIGRLLLV